MAESDRWNAEEKLARRYRYLRVLYRLSDGRRLADIPVDALKDELLWDQATFDAVDEWLTDEGLVEWPSFGIVNLTHRGIQFVEQLLTPSGAPGADDSVTVDEHREIERLVLEVRVALDGGRIKLSDEDAADADAQLATIDAQMRSPRPRRAVLQAAFRSLGRILEMAAGGALGTSAVLLSQHLAR